MDFQGQLDQAEAALRDLAPVLVTYFNSLVEAGMDEENAIYLVAELQNALLKPSA